jgi:hypothetical protein
MIMTPTTPKGPPILLLFVTTVIKSGYKSDKPAGETSRPLLDFLRQPIVLFILAEQRICSLVIFVPRPIIAAI